MARAIAHGSRPTAGARSKSRVQISRTLSRSPALLLALLLVATWGCAETILARSYPALSGQRQPLQRIAVAPFSVRGRDKPGEVPLGGVPTSAAALLSGHVADALAADGFEVVRPEEVRQLLASEQLAIPAAQRGRGPGDPRPLAWLVRHHFAADGLVMGEVSRFRNRVGDSYGASRAASVGFEVTLYSTPGSEKIWSAAFNETQRPMLENLFNVSRYPGGGSRWLSADELARWGAKEIARSLSSAEMSD